MNRKTLAALLISGALFSVGCEQPSQEPSKVDDILLRAESYFNQGQYSAASIEARNALKEDSRNLDANLLVARIYFQQGNYGNSIRVLKALPSDKVEVAELLGNNYLRQAKFKSLSQLLEELSKNDKAPPSWEINRLQAISLVQAGHFDKARTQIDKLASQANTADQKASAEIVRSYFYSETKDITRQVQALDQALAYQPGNVDALLEKAKLQYSDQNYEAAEDLLSQALISLPRTDVMTLKRLEVLQAMASTLSRQNRSGEAMIYSKLIAEANPRAQEIQNEFEQGIDKLQSGEVKEAEQIFSKLYVSDNARLAGSVLGLIKFQQGDYKEAAEFFENTVDPETASPELLRALAESQLRMRNPEQALKTIEANVKEHPENPDILSVYGLALLSTGRTQQGVDVVNKVLKLAPERVNLRIALSNAYNALGQPDKALQEVEKAYAANKNDIEIQERLSMQYAMMGKTSELTRFANELKQSSSVESQALAGLVLLRNDTKAGARLLDDLYAKSPSDPAVLRAQLRKNILLKDYQQVVRIGKQLVNLDSNDVATLGAITQAYSMLGDTETAVQYLIQLSDSSASAWGPDYILAAQAYSQKDLQRATDYINKSVVKSAYNPLSTRLYSQIYITKASRLAQDENYSAARDVVLEAMQNNEASPPLLHLLIRVELADNNMKEAEKLAAELNQVAANSQIANHAQGDIAAAKKDNNAALAYYQKAWALNSSESLAGDIWKQLADASPKKKDAFLADWQKKIPRSIVAKNLSGIRAQENGKAADAIKFYEASLTINENQPVILNNLAWLLMETGRMKDAYQFAEKAVALAGTNASILDTFGWIALKSGRKDIAIANLEKALQLEPDNEEIKAHLATAKK